MLGWMNHDQLTDIPGYEIDTVVYVKKIILVKPTVTVTAARPTSTVTNTITKTETDTFIPQASTTTTFSETVTETTTSVITETSTSTVIVPVTETQTSTVTSYAACATSNILGPQIQTGQYIQDVYYSDRTAQVQQPPATNAYDCCVACLTGTRCYISQFIGGTCFTLGNGAQCNNPGYTAGYFKKTTGPNAFNSVISNGPCGVVVDGGNV